MNTMRTLLLSLATASLALAGCDVAPNISGHWISEGIEIRTGANNSKLYVRRNILTSAKNSLADLFFSADEAGTQSAVNIVLDGTYVLTESWPAVPDAYAVDFTIKTLKITPWSSDMVSSLNSSPEGTCGLKPFTLGVTQDVSDTGCITLGLDVKNKPTEYDIVKREGNRLYYGAWPTDGSWLDSPEKRPTVLQMPLVGLD
jgi:hypothetical protein